MIPLGKIEKEDLLAQGCASASFLEESTRPSPTEQSVPFHVGQKAALKAIYAPFKTAYEKNQVRVWNRLEKIKMFLSALSEPFVWAGKELWNVLKPLTV